MKSGLIYRVEKTPPQKTDTLATFFKVFPDRTSSVVSVMKRESKLSSKESQCISDQQIGYHILSVKRKYANKNYPDARINVCQKSAQVDLRFLEDVEGSKDLDFSHILDSRWRPGMIEDGDLQSYLNEACAMFDSQLRELSTSDPLFANMTSLMTQKKSLMIKWPNSPQLKELLMNLLHFSTYNPRDALKLSKTHFALILRKLSSFSSLTSAVLTNGKRMSCSREVEKLMSHDMRSQKV